MLLHPQRMYMHKVSALSLRLLTCLSTAMVALAACRNAFYLDVAATPDLVQHCHGAGSIPCCNV